MSEFIDFDLLALWGLIRPDKSKVKDPIERDKQEIKRLRKIEITKI